MADDITTVLIRIIRGDNSRAAAFAGKRAGAQAGTADLLGAIANWAQIAGTAIGPVAQAEAALTIAAIAQEAAWANQIILDSGAENEAQLLGEVAQAQSEYAAAATFQYTLEGAVISLGVSLVLGLISALAGSDSAQSQQMADLAAEYDDLKAIASLSYWDDKLGGTADLLWAPVAGYLDEIKSEGTVGEQPRMHEPYYFGAVNDYVIEFTSGMDPERYWHAPPAQPAFGPPVTIDVPSGNEGFYMPLWFGDWPSPAAVAGGGGSVRDPATVLPYLSLGLNAWLTLNSLGQMIDPATESMTLTDYLTSFRDDLSSYLSLLYDQYALAVAGINTDDPSTPHWGIVKTKPAPSATDLIYYLETAAEPYFNTWLTPPWSPWNGVYGAVATYPSCGVHLVWDGYPLWPGNLAEPDVLQVSSASYFISRIDTTTQHEVTDADIVDGFERAWETPWIQNKVMLGTMARWKALYLINGYDSVWQVLTNLQAMLQPNPGIVPAVLRLDDGTIADGNWSARELCTLLKMADLPPPTRRRTHPEHPNTTGHTST